MAPVLVPLRPSSEALLRARAPGARDRHGWHSPFSPCAFCEQEGWSGGSLPFQACPFLSSEGCLLFTRIQRGGWCDLHCAHRATTASPWALCEHRDHASCLATPPPSSPISLHEGRLDGLPLARVQRGGSATARCASTEDHQAPSPLCSKHLLKEVVKAALHCAHRATTALSWGLCEQGG